MKCEVCGNFLPAQLLLPLNMNDKRLHCMACAARAVDIPSFAPPKNKKELDQFEIPFRCLVCGKDLQTRKELRDCLLVHYPLETIVEETEKNAYKLLGCP